MPQVHSVCFLRTGRCAHPCGERAGRRTQDFSGRPLPHYERMFYQRDCLAKSAFIVS